MEVDKPSVEDGGQISLSNAVNKDSIGIRPGENNLPKSAQNTQSLVLSSEECANLGVHPLLDESITSRSLHNQENGKALIMDMFLKSTVAYPQLTQNPDNDVKSLLVETTKKKFANPTMTMTVCSKKTIAKSRQNMISNCVQTTTVKRNDHHKVDDTFSKYFVKSNSSSCIPKPMVHFGSIGKTRIPHFGRFEYFLRPVQNIANYTLNFSHFNRPDDYSQFKKFRRQVVDLTRNDCTIPLYQTQNTRLAQNPVFYNNNFDEATNQKRTFHHRNEFLSPHFKKPYKRSKTKKASTTLIDTFWIDQQIYGQQDLASIVFNNRARGNRLIDQPPLLLNLPHRDNKNPQLLQTGDAQLKLQVPVDYARPELFSHLNIWDANEYTICINPPDMVYSKMNQLLFSNNDIPLKENKRFEKHAQEYSIAQIANDRPLIFDHDDIKPKRPRRKFSPLPNPENSCKRTGTGNAVSKHRSHRPLFLNDDNCAKNYVQLQQRGGPKLKTSDLLPPVIKKNLCRYKTNHGNDRRAFFPLTNFRNSNVRTNNVNPAKAFCSKRETRRKRHFFFDDKTKNRPSTNDDYLQVEQQAQNFMGRNSKLKKYNSTPFPEPPSETNLTFSKYFSDSQIPTNQRIETVFNRLDSPPACQNVVNLQNNLFSKYEPHLNHPLLFDDDVKHHRRTDAYFQAAQGTHNLPPKLREYKSTPSLQPLSETNLTVSKYFNDSVINSERLNENFFNANNPPPIAENNFFSKQKSHLNYHLFTDGKVKDCGRMKNETHNLPSKLRNYKSTPLPQPPSETNLSISKYFSDSLINFNRLDENFFNGQNSPPSAENNLFSKRKFTDDNVKHCGRTGAYFQAPEDTYDLPPKLRKYKPTPLLQPPSTTNLTFSKYFSDSLIDANVHNETFFSPIDPPAISEYAVNPVSNFFSKHKPHLTRNFTLKLRKHTSTSLQQPESATKLTLRKYVSDNSLIETNRRDNNVLSPIVPDPVVNNFVTFNVENVNSENIFLPNHEMHLKQPLFFEEKLKDCANGYFQVPKEKDSIRSSPILPTNFQPNLCSTRIDNSSDNINITLTKINTPLKNEWIKETDKFGCGFYVNKRTGMTSAISPKNTTAFNYAKRIDFVPKGLSPVLIATEKFDKSLSPKSKKQLNDALISTYENELDSIKWTNYLQGDDITKFFEQLYKEKSKQFESCIPNVSLPRSMRNTLQAYSFSKDMFGDITIVGQLDKKFIATFYKKNKLIILFDQHAVSERIRLEDLLQDYRIDGDGIFKTITCDNKITEKFSENDLFVLKNYKHLFENLGLHYTIVRNQIEISHAPQCVHFQTDKNRVEQFRSVIVSLVNEQIEMIKSTRGTTSNIPHVIQNLINMEACRGAIKFGDQLSVSECEVLIGKLSKCQLPFQCAHGRPTLTSIISLEKNCSPERLKPNLRTLMK